MAKPLPRIGFISPHWLPSFGGAEQYAHRMARELSRRGFDVRVFTQTAERRGYDNGSVAATRLGGLGEFEPGSFLYRGSREEPAVANLGKHYAFMDAAARWVEENGIEVCILDNGLQQVDFIHFRELYSVLRAMGVKRGLIHHDLAPSVQNLLAHNYRNSLLGWEQVGHNLRQELRAYVRGRGRFHAAFMMGSPLAFDPDFVISCSAWSESFIDPLDSVPKIVLHPLIDPTHWRSRLPEDRRLSSCSALMVNPQARKGGELMRMLIADAEPTWTFRVLRGGWGEAFQTFRPQVSQTRAAAEGRIDFCDYVADMRQAYQSAGVLFFPSLQEGYGMTPVEAMHSGTPAVSSSYPAILEAVGDSALTLCPHKDNPPTWRRAVAEVLSERPAWIARAQAQCGALSERQDREVVNLCNFLSGIAG